MDEPLLPEHMFPALLNFSNALHGRNRCSHKLSVIANWNISPLLEIDGRVLRGEQIKNRQTGTDKIPHDSHLLAMRLAESFRPSHFPRVPLHSRRKQSEQDNKPQRHY